MQIKDNWGWCNGTCTALDRDGVSPSPGGAGCYDKSWNEYKTNGIDYVSNNECDLTIKGSGASTTFKGRIILSP